MAKEQTTSSSEDEATFRVEAHGLNGVTEEFFKEKDFFKDEPKEEIKQGCTPKLIYICSPYSTLGNREENIEVAKQACNLILKQGDIPICPHLFYGATGVLDDDIPSERKTGIKAGLELLEYCDGMLIVGDISKGMKDEIAAAVKGGMECIVYYSSLDFKDPNFRQTAYIDITD